MIETVTLLTLLAFGWVLLGAFGMRGWPLIPLGFLAGSFAVVVVTTALGVAGFPTRPSVVMGVLVTVATILAFARAEEVAQSFSRWFPVGAGGLAAVVVVARSVHLVSYHIDSYRYLVMSGLLTSDFFSRSDMNLLTKRMMSAPALHALADLGGEAYLRAFTPLLAISVLGIVAWALLREDQLTRGVETPSRTGIALVALAVLSLVTINRFVWHAFYLNDHLYFGAALVVIAAGSWILLSGEREAPVAVLALVSLATAALVVTRPEGFIIALLALVPLVSRLEKPWYRETALASYALASVGYYGHLYLRVSAAALEITGPLVVGGTGLLLIAALRRRNFRLLQRPAPYLVELAVLMILFLFFRRDSSLLTQSLQATWQNVGRGAGGWGSSLLMLSGLAILALLISRDHRLLALRFPATIFLPVAFLLPYLSGGAYRVGPGDSLNRMLIQVVPVAVLFVVAAAQTALRTPTTTSTRDVDAAISMSAADPAPTDGPS